MWTRSEITSHFISSAVHSDGTFSEQSAAPSLSHCRECEPQSGQCCCALSDSENHCWQLDGLETSQSCDVSGREGKSRGSACCVLMNERTGGEKIILQDVFWLLHLSFLSVTTTPLVQECTWLFALRSRRPSISGPTAQHVTFHSIEEVTLHHKDVARQHPRCPDLSPRGVWRQGHVRF